MGSLMQCSLTTALLAMTTIGGCSLAPQYERPAAPVPVTLPSYSTTQPGDTETADINWETFFADRQLCAVLRAAFQNNRDLRIAALNVERARALYNLQRADLLPVVDVGAAHTRQRIPADLSATGERMTAKQYNVDVGLSWEIDFFGRVRSLSDAALQDFFATEQARRGAQILLMTDVANAYLTLAADREALAVAQDTLRAQQDSQALVQKRFDQGIVPRLDVHRAAAQVETARGAVARYTSAVAQDRELLNLLVGQVVPDEMLVTKLSSVATPREISAGLSSEVLLRRPDILQAESRLKAAYANIGAARAAFFPRISLLASAGTASDELSGLFDSGSGTWSFAPRVSMPIFDGRTWAAARVSKVERELAIARYEQVIQSGFREVADALAVRSTIDQQVSAQESFVREMAETYSLSVRRYERGVDNYLSVLDAQRSLFAARQELVFLQLASRSSRVRLYAALGGGTDEPLPHD